jgi:pyridoxal phosphate enzyme (YggS family)
MHPHTPEAPAAEIPDIAQNLDAVAARISKAAKEAGREPDEITVVAVSKKHGPQRILPALEHGHRVFGENRVQEAAAKWPTLRDAYPDLKLHLIGPLQSNKAADAVALFDVIETIDRPKIARMIADALATADRRPGLLIQVNIGEEAQKAGVSPQAADAFIRQCREEFGLTISGLMCIPPIDAPPAPFFALLEKIARRNDLRQVSMGMSADFDIAVQLGATHVRIGSEIFGARPE